MTQKTRILTGIKPTGQLHLGNYHGAIQPMVALSQDPQNEVLLMCPDWHGLTNRAGLLEPGERTPSVMASFLALGFQLKNNTIFLQSDFPQIQENAWYLSCTCAAGLLERSHAYKDALANGKDPTSGLLFYPVLMAADIVTFGAQLVPVGKDQMQHLEYASDMVKLFNNAVQKKVFLEPKGLVQDFPVLLGTDGRKMSKSYQNTIPLFAPKKELEKAVKEIQTDSKGLDEPKNPETCLVYQLFQSFASKDAQKNMKERLERGVGYGYGHAKKDFIEEHERVFGSKRELYEHYVHQEDSIKTLLKEGMERARSYAVETTAKARQALGLKSYLC